ncbi:MAG: ABC transporter substrate binding protein [Thermodesulfobacteriota bacterium]|nr:ABC transporter substrate binding protein [Thermodesulfobacteriota bacterium]
MIRRVVLIVVLIILCRPFYVNGKTVLALKSIDAEACDQAIKGFMSVFRGQELKMIVFDNLGTEAEISAVISENSPDLILCIGSNALRNALSIKSVPKIFCLVAHPESIISPDNVDIFGIDMDLPVSTQFRILATHFPKLQRIGAMYNPELSGEYIEKARKNAEDTPLELVTRPVNTIRDIPSALNYLKDRVDILWAFLDATAYGPETARYVLLFALRKGIPFIGFSEEFAKAGALVAFYGDYKDMGCQSALLAKKILANEPLPKPIIEPRKVRIAVNKKVARSMAISFTSEFLAMVDQVY